MIYLINWPLALVEYARVAIQSVATELIKWRQPILVNLGEGMSDQAIENEIVAKGLTAPRVTPADIEANIVGEHYFTAADAVGSVTNDMVSLFLSWRLPEDFEPDCYIRFTPVDGGSWPTGTNLLHAGQAKAMLEHVLQPQPHHDSLALLTFCVLLLKNGFTVTGESACASPENFNAELGRKIARQNAMQKVWPLMGYALKERLSNP